MSKDYEPFKRIFPAGPGFRILLPQERPQAQDQFQSADDARYQQDIDANLPARDYLYHCQEVYPLIEQCGEDPDCTYKRFHLWVDLSSIDGSMERWNLR